jgi:hypothetical protein
MTCHLHGFRRTLIARCAGIALALMLGWSGELHAQVDVVDWGNAPQRKTEYDSVRKQFDAPLSVYDYHAVFVALRRDLHEQNAWQKNEPEYVRLDSALGIIVTRFREFDRELAVRDVGAALNAFLASNPTGLFQFPCPADRCFRSDIQVSYAQIEALTTPKANDFLFRVYTVSRLLADFRAPALDAAVQAIGQASERWRSYVQRGRSQYPWEAVFNSLALFRAPSTIERPPQRQWIFAHPELGAEFGPSELAGAGKYTADESLTIHALGLVWYRSWENQPMDGGPLRWYGIAATMSLRDDRRPGYGLTLHHGRDIVIGPIWRDSDGDGKLFDQPPSWVAGIDLYRAAKKGASTAEKILAKRDSLVRQLDALRR